MPSEVQSGVPFAFFCSLLREISQIKPRTTATRLKIKRLNGGDPKSYPALDIFNRWLAELRKRYSPLPEGTTSIVFRLLFPEEDTKRKYEIRESRLISCLSQVLGLSKKDLESWNAEDASGCLGLEVMRLLETNFSGGDKAESPFTIADVNNLLDELASTSSYTHSSIRSKFPTPHRSRTSILKDLFRPLPPFEASFLIHIILKDLRPILYPSPETHSYSASLLDYNSNAVKMLRKEDVILAWDESRYLSRFCRVKTCLDEAAKAYEMPNCSKPRLVPCVGSMVPLPKSTKGTGCRSVLSSHFQQSEKVWAETKYDGERAQIHVNVQPDGSPQIKIFSKSKRDSTEDRFGIHEIILETLGFPTSPAHRHTIGSGLRRCNNAKIRKNVIFDAEMVAWFGDSIDEFWRIDALVNKTGTGARSKRGLQHTLHDSDSDDEIDLSLMTDESQNRHLALVFFDVLMLDDESLIFQSYGTRRKLLQSLIIPLYSRSMLSARWDIDMTSPDPVAVLQKIFAEHHGNNLEGIVLKAEESEYNDWRLPWVKLKADYIPGFGDCIDLMIVAAGWDRDRARELRVTPNVYTTFWVGVITNTRDIRMKSNTKPHVLVYFTVSYGLTREQLEDFNFRIRNGENIPFTAAAKDYQELPFTFAMSPHLLGSNPQVIISNPFLAELLCASFSKDRGSIHYQPRFPRITKLHSKQERPWTECMDISELDKIALRCVGKDRPSKDIDDWANTLWGKPTSPTIRQKRYDRVQDIQESLARLEGNLRDPKETVKRRKVSHERHSGSKAAKATPTGIAEQHSVIDLTKEPEHCMEVPPSIAMTVAVHDDSVKTFPGVPTPSASLNLQSSLVAVSWFMKSNIDSDCDKCLRWKKEMTRHQRVHSLESMLVGCGVGGGLVSIHQGHIFIHAEDTTGLEATLRKIQEKRDDIKSPILIFQCDTDALVEQHASFVF